MPKSRIYQDTYILAFASLLLLAGGGCKNATTSIQPPASVISTKFASASAESKPSSHQATSPQNKPCDIKNSDKKAISQERSNPDSDQGEMHVRADDGKLNALKSILGLSSDTNETGQVTNIGNSDGRILGVVFVPEKETDQGANDRKSRQTRLRRSRCKQRGNCVNTIVELNAKVNAEVNAY